MCRKHEGRLGQTERPFQPSIDKTTFLLLFFLNGLQYVYPCAPTLMLSQSTSTEHHYHFTLCILILLYFLFSRPPVCISPHYWSFLTPTSSFPLSGFNKNRMSEFSFNLRRKQFSAVCGISWATQASLKRDTGFDSPEGLACTFSGQHVTPITSFSSVPSFLPWWLQSETFRIISI